MKIRIQKLQEAPNPTFPNNIPVGFDQTMTLKGRAFEPPTVGERFWPGDWWSTSTVREIIDEKTFRTSNSIYQWEKLIDEVD